ncbi:RHS repeat-associated core domain-containing protein [Micromonospora sp. WMMD1082]|uniref:RHS repeat-associated core domain-containing protein n=1 Tax=Micromonospora sp. WMMD1082 TaxID=3016104 RepID=UPI0024171870|nr:RHS repeat-associated core domain-containing protein [Micromonospora sp. WMMD1082]MDG4795817.1 RHS repeat-associated core domain-containing protein [Micromonospora sp. WMMD1082]
MALVIAAASTLVAGPAPAAPAAAPPSGAGIEPVVSPRSGPNMWLFTSGAAPAARQAVAAAGAAPSVPKGTGPVRNGTLLSFSLTDRLAANVNVGSGNLLLTSTELTLPGIAENVTLGASFNSLLLGSDIANGAHGPGWRTRSGVDVRLIEATTDNSVTYVAADGVVGTFAASGSAYTSPGEFKAKLARNGAGWKLTENDSGKVLFFTADGLLDKTEDRNGNVVDFSYSAGRMTTVTSNRGVGSVRSAAVTYTGDRLTRYRHTGSDGNWRQVSYEYDTANRLKTIQSATWRKVSFEYNSAGDLTKILMEDDTLVTITYDGQHRVTSLTQVTDNATMRGSTTRLAYTSSTVTDVADPRQDISQPVTSVPHTTYTLNSEKRVTKVTDPAGNSRSKTYTPFSDVATSTSAEGGSTTNTYGANGGQSQTKSESPTGASASAAYANAATATNPTANFQPSSSINTQGNSSTYTYNGAGNQTSSKDALAAEAKVDYNSDGTVKSSTDPGNGTNATTYSYDSNKQLTTMTPPTGNNLSAKTFTYDTYGRLRTEVSGGCTTSYEYSLDDRLTKTSYTGCASTTAVSQEHGGSGNLLTRTDATGTTTYQYDQLNRLRRRTAPGGTLQTYRPDPVGNLEELVDGRGTTRYYYNTRNWLVRMDTAGGTRYNFDYDKDGNRLNTWFATNDTNSSWALRVTTTYDRSDRPKRITATRNSAAQATVFDVTHCYAKYVSGQACSTAKADDTGLRQWQRNETNSQITQYTYDKGDRLTKATNHQGKTYDYAYNTNGNRTSVQVDGATTQTLAYNSANQVTTTDNTYDTRGNQTKVSAPAVSGIGYNAAKQMTTATGTGTGTGTGTTTYAYAGTDQVELTRAGAINLTYGMNDQHGIPWLQSWTNGVSLPVHVERDGLGTPLGLRIGTIDHAFVLDGLGSVVAVVKADGSQAASYTYDPYGSALTATETGLGQTNIIRYAGGIHDPSTTFTKYGQRWYNPTQGRFTQQDNLSFIGNPQHGNRYAYAGCNPTNNIDPTGQCSVDSYIGLVGGLVASVSAGVGTWLAGFTLPFAAGAWLLGGAIVASLILLGGIVYCLNQDF